MLITTTIQLKLGWGTLGAGPIGGRIEICKGTPYYAGVVGCFLFQTLIHRCLFSWLNKYVGGVHRGPKNWQFDRTKSWLCLEERGHHLPDPAEGLL